MQEITQKHDSSTVNQDAYAGIKVRFQAAPLSKRILALVIDMGIVSLIFYLVMIFFGILIGIVLVSSGKSFENFFRQKDLLSDIRIWWLFGLVLSGLLSMVVANHGYFIWYEYKKGLTPGKKIMGIRVISIDGGKLSLRQCIGREVLRYIDCGLIFPGLLSTLLTDKKQRLGDLFAGTVVVHSTALENEKQFLYLSQEDFLLIKSHVKMGLHDSKQEEDCLRHAYQYLIRGLPIEAATVQMWESFADQLVETPVDFPMQAREKFLFVAECFRQKANK